MLLAGLITNGVAAVPLSLECPEHYPDRQQAFQLQSKGWHVLSGSQAGLTLSEAGVLVGEAADNGVLRGADLPHGSGRQFNFSGTTADGNTWFYCQYGSGIGARLAYPLPVGLKQCRTAEHVVRQQLVKAGIRCG